MTISSLSLRSVSAVAALVLGAALSPLLTTSLQAQGLTNYNVLTFGGFYQENTEVNGTLAVGGNFAMKSAAVGASLTGKAPNGALVVGGTTKIENGSVYRGDSYLKSAATGSGYNLQGTTNIGSVPVDFVSEYARLSSLSAELAAQAAASGIQPVTKNSQLWFHGTQQVNYFTVSASTLATSWGGYNFYAPEGATIIVNVTGFGGGNTLLLNTGFNFCTNEAAFLNGTGCPQVNGDNPGGLASRLLWNLNSSTETTVAFAGSMRGSVLAPNVNLNATYGSCSGDFVLRSATSNCEFYMNRYQGYLPPVQIPEPSSLALMGLGVAALSWRVTRRRAR